MARVGRVDDTEFRWGRGLETAPRARTKRGLTASGGAGRGTDEEGESGCEHDCRWDREQAWAEASGARSGVADIPVATFRVVELAAIDVRKVLAPQILETSSSAV